METLKVNHGSWPMRGGLASITNTPSYRPAKYPAPARNAFTDNLPVAAFSHTSAPLPDMNKTKSRTPSPQKAAVGENISPAVAGKENLATPAPKK